MPPPSDLPTPSAPLPTGGRLPPPPKRPLLGALILAGVALLPACRHDSGPSDGPRSTTTDRVATTMTSTTEVTTTTKPLTPKEQVETAYLKAVSTYYEVARHPDPDNPALAATRSGPSLAKAWELLSGFRKNDIEVQYIDDKPPTPRIRGIAFVGQDRAFVTACLVDDARQVRASDGSVVNDAVVSRLDKADLRRQGSIWRMYGLEALNGWKDGHGCDR